MKVIKGNGIFLIDRKDLTDKPQLTGELPPWAFQAALDVVADNYNGFPTLFQLQLNKKGDEVVIVLHIAFRYEKIGSVRLQKYTWLLDEEKEPRQLMANESETVPPKAEQPKRPEPVGEKLDA